MTRAAKITKASNIVSFFLPGLLKDELAIVFFDKWVVKPTCI